MWLLLPDIGGWKSMNRIRNAFMREKAFIAFVTGGDPNLDITEQLLYKIEEAGADLIEIGIPFSDPIAEGPVIQEANERALKAGCTTDNLFAMVKRARKTVKVPLVFLTYMNPIYTYGKKRFFEACRDCGIDGIIVPDLPFEEKEEILKECKEFEVALISLIAPTSKERITRIAKEAEGFVYCVSSLGVTGIRSKITTDLKSMVALVKSVSAIPVAVGFGIATPEQAKEVAAVADGAIVGSAIVKIVKEYGAGCIEPVYAYVRKMKQAVKSV